jgi:hypothetical protein
MQLSFSKAQGTVLGAAIGGTGGAAKLSEALTTVTLYGLGLDKLPEAVAQASGTISNVAWTVAIMAAGAVLGRLFTPAAAPIAPTASQDPQP